MVNGMVKVHSKNMVKEDATLRWEYFGAPDHLTVRGNARTDPKNHFTNSSEVQWKRG